CLAGVRESIDSSGIPDGSVIVCTLTGHGLKDPDTAIAQSPTPTRVRADAAEVRAIILAD
ncbi:MAG TPA: threonine synthase, partial [Gammaproteobacteria bacterium]|nr:threonine synthase [Gammaproteobacteria bacterium]